MEHDVHSFTPCWYPKADGRATIDPIGNSLLLRTKLNFQVEAPEGNSLFSMQTNSGYLTCFAELLSVFLLNAGGPSLGAAGTMKVCSDATFLEESAFVFGPGQVYLRQYFLNWLNIERFPST